MRRTLPYLVAAVLVSLTGSAVAASAPLKWPIKPFNRAHIIRATFGEPRGFRVRFPPGMGRGEFLMDNLDDSGRVKTTFTRYIHHGVDIVAKANKPVYSLVDGRALVNPALHQVRVGRFAYVHLYRTVKNGAKVKAFKTVLGYVEPSQEHVHFTMYSSEHGDSPINPLSSAGFVGYYDYLAPVLEGLEIYQPNGQLYQQGDGGPVEIFVNAYDRVSIGSPFRGTDRQVGIYSLSYVLFDEDFNEVSQEEVWRFDRYPTSADCQLVYLPLSYRIRQMISSGQPDGVHFYYRLSRTGPMYLTPQHKYFLWVWASDAFGNIASRGYNIVG